MKIITWNVNGIRAAQKKGFINWVNKEKPDILCLQETKANVEQLDREIINIEGYSSYWSSANRKGYSGVATYVKNEPVMVDYGIGIEKFDTEGRILITAFEEFILLNIYFPNGQMGEDRLKYKLEFYEEIIKYCNIIKDSGKKVVICGDFNTAHHEIDLKNPKANEKTSGFLPIERELLDKFLSFGYIDVFRQFYPEEVKYSWWSYRTRARERDAGWRIDYFYVSDNFIKDVKDCQIMNEVQGSDHCPIRLELK